MWHVSLSIGTARGPLPTTRWSRQQRHEAARQARRLLDGVGVPTTDVGTCYPFTFQLRRVLAPVERGMLDAAWMALPAVDEGGTPEEVAALLRAIGLDR